MPSKIAKRGRPMILGDQLETDAERPDTFIKFLWRKIRLLSLAGKFFALLLTAADIAYDIFSPRAVVFDVVVLLYFFAEYSAGKRTA